MIFFRPFCIACMHKGDTSMEYQGQLKSSLHTLYCRYRNLIDRRYDISISFFSFTYTCFPLSPTHFLLDFAMGNTVGIRRRSCLPITNNWVHPSPVFNGIRVAHIFSLFLDLFTNVVCVSRVHPLF
jgi:hypothetical protein